MKFPKIGGSFHESEDRRGDEGAARAGTERRIFRDIAPNAREGHELARLLYRGRPKNVHPAFRRLGRGHAMNTLEVIAMKLIRNSIVASVAFASLAVAACSSQHGATGTGSASNGNPIGSLTGD